MACWKYFLTSNGSKKHKLYKGRKLGEKREINTSYKEPKIFHQIICCNQIDDVRIYVPYDSSPEIN